MRAYLDTCFLVRLYLTFPESGAADARMQALSERPVLTWLTEVEAINAFERYVFESANGAPMRVTRELAASAQASLREDLESGEIYEVAAVGLSPLRHHFESLSLRHTARHGFRTYDLLHVASAIALRCEAFWTFDGKARALAKLEGLETD